ncbi:minor tail protein [Mycobacterium phage MyraDee]|uniref:Minor tail protein n=1 Tax=Mycobacterium phage MyraDee TaxID=2024303 RepID=A0A222YXV4_9CAUD|nr:minor tail protein [Mycobacterium phage MyraDee]ASR77132.1 minor tail protein [Mycobacterium phage MyraDee]
MRTVVELEGVNGEWFNLTDGDRGIWLGTGVTGLYDPPVKVVYEEPGNYPGARYLSHRILRRDIVFGVEILNDKGSDSWMSRDSEWRKAWAFDRDCKLHITTEQSGHRYLKLRLGESPDISLFTDPDGETITRVGMVCVSGDPFWYEDDVVYSALTSNDTTFDPNPLPWPWPQAALPTETLYITVDPADGKGGLNPTDQYTFLKWQVPGSTKKPAAPYIPGIEWLGAPKSPATIWTIPDYSFEDPEKANRRLRMPSLIGGLRTNATQIVKITGNPSGGFFQLSLDGVVWTNNIPRNASPATLKTAVAALPGVGAANIDVTGGPIPILNPWQPYQIVFKGIFEGLPVATLQTRHTLTGGSQPWVYAQTSIEGVTAPAENAVIDTDPRVEQVASESGSPLWARMNGVRFRHPVPPWTKSHTFEITVSGCEPGQMVTLRIPRAWTRPWGLE